MRYIGIALVALLATFQISAIQAQTVVYDVDVSGLVLQSVRGVLREARRAVAVDIERTTR